MNLLRIISSIILVLVLIIPYSFAATTAVVTVTAVILPGQNDISVDTSTVNFGSVTGSTGNRRFVAGPVNVSYFAGTSPWTIRVYTANPDHRPGLIGPSVNIPLKAWCDNYGPRLNPLGHAPDEENRYFWSGWDFNRNGSKEDTITDGSISEVALGLDVNGDGDALDTGLGTVSAPVYEGPVWLNVPDVTSMITGQPYTWRRLTYSGAELDTSGFPVYFAIDVTGIPPDSYMTTTLTFEIINE